MPARHSKLLIQNFTKMDNTTMTFVASLVIAFVFLRWFISTGDATQTVPPTARASAPMATRTRSKRQVNEDMIEVVQSLLPKVAESDIRASLEKTGSVEATVEELMKKKEFSFQEEKERMIAQAREKYLSKH